MKIICNRLQDKIFEHDRSFALAGRFLRQIDGAGEMSSTDPFQDNGRRGVPGEGRENGHPHVLFDERSSCELAVTLKGDIRINPGQGKVVLDHFCKGVSGRKNDEFLSSQIGLCDFWFLCQGICC